MHTICANEGRSGTRGLQASCWRRNVEDAGVEQFAKVAASEQNGNIIRQRRWRGKPVPRGIACIGLKQAGLPRVGMCGAQSPLGRSTSAVRRGRDPLWPGRDCGPLREVQPPGPRHVQRCPVAADFAEIGWTPRRVSSRQSPVTRQMTSPTSSAISSDRLSGPIVTLGPWPSSRAPAPQSSSAAGRAAGGNRQTLDPDERCV
jgi:hypothetical protein